MKPQTVLLVDDERVILNTMAQFLERIGHQVFTAETAEDAIQIMNSHPVEIVITDIMLPGQNGLELTRQIRSDHNADVIVMTGYSENYSYEEAITIGASDFVFKPVRFQELRLRIERVQKERQLTHERAAMMEKLQILAITDDLTQLYNSRHFFKQLTNEIERSNRYGHALALLMLDIDHFKQYNDRYGHLQGDQVLRSVGKIIQSRLRSMDSAYRYGGEEFTIILPETTGRKAASAAQRLRRAMADQPFTPAPDNANVTVTLSIGVAAYQPGESLADFVQRADSAMYQAKADGRNQVHFAHRTNDMPMAASQKQ